MKKNKKLIALIILDLWVILYHINAMIELSVYLYIFYFEEVPIVGSLLGVFNRLEVINYFLAVIGLFLTIVAYNTKNEEYKRYRPLLMIFIILLSLILLQIYIFISFGGV